MARRVFIVAKLTHMNQSAIETIFLSAACYQLFHVRRLREFFIVAFLRYVLSSRKGLIDIELNL